MEVDEIDQLFGWELDELDRHYQEQADRRTGILQILSPERYLERGTFILNAIEDAINAYPLEDTLYPHWHIRYVNAGEQHLQELLKIDGYYTICSGPQLNIEVSGPHWYRYNFYSKEAFARQGNYSDKMDSTNTAEIFVSVKTGTIIMSLSNAAADIDIPEAETQRLYNSELMYQAWSDACSKYFTDLPLLAQLRRLKYIIRGPIVNFGTVQTIRHALESQGVHESEESKPERFTFGSAASDEFKMLMGTDNGRPIGRLCADHAQTFGKKRVVKIHAWYPFPENNIGTLVFELDSGESIRPTRSTARQRITAFETVATAKDPHPAREAQANGDRKVTGRVKDLIKKFEN